VSAPNSGGSLPIPFALGVTVWRIGDERREIVEKCPDCLGQCTIIVELRTGERFEVECKTCWPGGFEPARGVVVRYEYPREPRPFTPRRVTMHGDEFWYSESPPDADSCSTVSEKNIFHDREKCQAACDAQNKELAEHNLEQFYARAKRGRKDQAWNLHYWRKERAQLVTDIERIDARIKQIDERAAARKARS
jgi:hypothetical protein